MVAFMYAELPLESWKHLLNTISTLRGLPKCFMEGRTEEYFVQIIYEQSLSTLLRFNLIQYFLVAKVL